MNWKEVGIGVVTLFLVIAFLIIGAHYMNVSDELEGKKEDQRFTQANTICGTPPLRIIPHNSSWSHGGWIEVRCKDGSTRAIR